ncbi:CHAT domain-containing protein [Phenylobacterium deserti]|uniref:CHAT domain-containing protein n=1 Tax=Phenylobacterium deserti TaxID=1914756 RepID=UPI0010581264|nr:CHAT domain-containing protein [Phenylobacterium deserti]
MLASIDRTLSLIATVQNPQLARLTIACALSDVIEALRGAGEIERAYGLYKAAGVQIGEALPATSLDHATWRLREAELLQQIGQGAAAGQVLDLALAALAAIQVSAEVKEPMLARAGRLKAGLTDAEETLGGAFGGSGEVDRLASVALAEADPALRARKLAQLGKAIRVDADGAGAARWRRPGLLDQRLIGLVLTHTDDRSLDAETAFALHQLAGRTGPSFDAEALTRLASAKDEITRRTTHQMLRLTARRDRLVRQQIQGVALRMLEPPSSAAILQHDIARRQLIADFDRRIAAAEAQLGDPAAISLVSLRQLQTVLGPDEAVLALSKTAGGHALLCVRRDGAMQSYAPVNAARLRLDGRLVQAALTAGHAPSEDADSQYPVEAAVRLYDVLIRPFEPCLKPGDRLIWLSGTAGAPVPLAALPASAPPKLQRGYDLGAGDWLVKRHAISYAGSAGVILASRTGGGTGGDLDFLGVGDPVLGGSTAAGEDATKVVLRGLRSGVRLDGLEPLPETRDELEASAKGFRSSRLLLQGQATERGWRQEMVGAYRYLSFATHGLIRDDLQGLAEPALVFTPVSAADPNDDGLLTASEIADLNLRARFVALSACNTANFDMTQMAQDLPALSSAFAVAGTPSTLGTLWPVNSETGKQVVTGLFARLRDQGLGPAEALAQAQRSFLAAPPSRAYLHPRFWAPFVILGDGTPPAAAETAKPALSGVEVLTERGGEVLSLAQAPGGVAARLIADKDADGRQAAAVRLASGSGSELWREATADGASRVLVQLDAGLLSGGYALTPAGRYAPKLTLLKPDGARAGETLGAGLASVDAFPMAAARLDGEQAVVAVGELNLRDAPGAGGGRLHLLAVGADLRPRGLFTVSTPAAEAIESATVTPLGNRLLVTVTYVGATVLPLEGLDDYDAATCRPQRATLIELRDLATGQTLAAQTFDGVSVIAAVAQGRGVWLGGARRTPCGEDRAVVLALDDKLAPRTLYEDANLGASQVRTLALTPGGAFAAASKANVTDYRAPDVAAAARADPYALRPFPDTYSGLLVTLDRRGRPSTPRLLDSGSNIYVTTALAQPSGEILVGGAVAGQAAIFKLRER